MTRSWLAAILAFLGFFSTPAHAQDKHEVAFLLDVSCSMPNVTWSDGTTFEQVTAKVRDKARSVLLPYQDTDLLSITFYEFGDLVQDEDGQWVAKVRVSSGGEALNAAQAIDFVGGFFPTDRKHYADGYTYVARSVYDVARRELALSGDPAAAPVAIPDDARPLTILVFTDAGDQASGGGGESHARDRSYDHATWQGWLDEHVDGNQLEYLNWDLSASGVGFLAAADHRIYNARWGQPSKGGVFDVERTAAGATPLSVHPTMRLVSRLTMPPDDREHVCTPRRDGPIAASPAATVDVLAEVRWQAGEGPARTERIPWKLEAPARPLEGAGDDAYLPAMSLPLRITNATLQLGDLSGYALGHHPIAFAERELCDALTGQYPHSTVVLPVADDEVAPIAEVELVSKNLYDFVIESREGSPTATWPDLVANRSHVFPMHTRSYALSAVREETPPAQVTWTTRVLKDGEDLPDPSAFLGVPDVSEGRRLEVPAGATVTLNTPGTEQPWWRFGRAFPYEAGTYEVQMCGRVAVSQPDDEPFTVAVSCPTCDEARVSAQDAGACIASTLTVQPRPVSWWAIALTTAAILFALWFSYRWMSRKRFEEGLTIGKLSGSGFLRAEYEEGLDGRINLFFHRPCYLELGPKGSTRFLLRYEPAGVGGGCVIGLRPDDGQILIWCVRHPLAPDGLTWKVRASTSSDALRPLDTRDPGLDLAPGELLSVSMPPPRKATLTVSGSNAEGVQRRETYEIEIKS